MKPGWKVRRLSHLSDIPITNGLGEAAVDGDPAWPRYIRTTDIAGLFVLDDSKRVTLPPAIARPAMVSRGDLLMTAAGSLGTSYLHESNEPACYAGYLVRFRPNKSVCDGRFVAWWTQSQAHLDQIATGAVRSTIDNFSASKFKALRIALPPLPEQRAIAAFLDREAAEIDALVAKQEGLMRVLRERRATLITHSIRHSGHPEVRLRSFVRIYNGTSHKEYEAEDGQYPVYGSGGAFARASRYSHEGASVVFGRKGTVDRPQYVDGCFWTSDTAFYTVIPDNVSARWFYYAALTLPFDTIKSNTALPSMTQSDLAECRVPLPPLKEQHRIADYLDEVTGDIDALIATTGEFITVAKERRATLITAAVTGQIDCTTTASTKDTGTDSTTGGEAAA